MGLLSQLAALAMLGGAVLAYLRATQSETLASFLQRLRAVLLERLEWDLATVLPELAPQPEPEPATAATFVGGKKGRHAVKKPKAKPQAASSAAGEGAGGAGRTADEADDADEAAAEAAALQEQVELRLDLSDGNWYPRASFVDLYGGARQWDLQVQTSRMVDADGGSGAAGGTGVRIPTLAFSSCIPTGMHAGPICIFWANLTPFSLGEPWATAHLPTSGGVATMAGAGGGGAGRDEWWGSDEEVDQVRKTASRPRRWANFSFSQLHSHRNAGANLHILVQPDTCLAPVGDRRRREEETRSAGAPQGESGGGGSLAVGNSRG
jgi:hypothetical protein